MESDMMTETIQSEHPQFLFTVGLMMTYRCTVACSHCIVKAGPHRTEEMDTEDACRWLQQLSEYGSREVEAVALTGGEPFYNTTQLQAISEYAGKLGLVVTAVTNAYWADSKEKAVETLASMRYIDAIAVSADVPHQQFIPLQHVKNAIWAARVLSREYNVSFSTHDLQDPDYLAMKNELLEEVTEEKMKTTIILEVGRAAKAGKNKQLPYPAQGACNMASYPVFFPNGDVIACIGPLITLPRRHPLYLGNAKKESVADIFDKAKKNTLLHAIRAFGPQELVTLLRENGYEKLTPDEFAEDSICDVCYRLFKDSYICRALYDLSENDKNFTDKVNAGRYHYFGENPYE